MTRCIWQLNEWRIMEVVDDCTTLEDLKGDCYCPKTNPDISPEKLREEEGLFEKLVEYSGVFGYVLEKWNPAIDKGWEHLDSCFGFVGQYSKEYNEHYIINELKSLTKGENNE